jgi:tetratricopeptide (TPR) repeat protein
VRVTAELIEAASDAHLWAGSFEGDLADSFRVQEEIARKVSGQLMSSIQGMQPMPAGAMPTQGAAFDAVLEGRHLLERRSPEAVQGAVEAFRKAIRVDSGYAPGYAGLSGAYVLHVVYGTPRGLDHYVATARALAAADRALELDPQSAEGYQARSDALLISLAPEGEIVEALRKARQRMPGSVSVYLSTAHALEHFGRWPAALQQVRRALELDPLSTGVRHSAITVALGARDYDFALTEARRARAFDPSDQVALVLQAYAQLLKGDGAACATLAAGPWAATRAMCLHQADKTEEARTLGDSLGAQLDAGRYLSIHQFADLAAYRAWVGDAAGALGWVQKGARLSPMIHYWHLDSGLFDRVKDDTVFTAGLDRLREQIRERLDGARRHLGDRLE